MISRTTTFVKTKLSSREKRLMRQRIEEQDALVDQLRSSTIPSLEQRAKDLEEQVATGQRNAGTVQQLTALLADQSALIGQLRDTIPLLQRRIAEQEREIRRREDALDSARAHADALEKLRPQAAQCEVLQARGEILQGENVKLQERLDAAQCKELEYAATISELAPLRALPESLAEREARVADLESTLRLLEEEHYTANEEAKKQADTIGTQKRTIDTQTDTIDTQKTELESLRPLVLKLEAANKDAAQRFAVLEKQHTALETKHTNLEAQHAGQTQMLAALEPLPGVVAQKDALIDDMERRISALDEQLVEKTTTIAELEQKTALVDDLRAQLDTLTKEKDSTLAALESLRPLLSQKAVELADKDVQLAEKDLQLSQDTAKLEALQKQLGAANALAEDRAAALVERDALVDGLRGSLYGLADVEREKERLEVRLAAAQKLADEQKTLVDEQAATRVLLVEKAARVEELEGQLAALKTRAVADVNVDGTTALRRVEELEADKLRLEEELAALKMQTPAAVLKELEDGKLRLEGEVAALKAQLASDDNGVLLKELEANKLRLEGELAALKIQTPADNKAALVRQLEADKLRLEAELAAAKTLADGHASARAHLDEKTNLISQLDADKQRLEGELAAALKTQAAADDKTALVAQLEADKQHLENQLAETEALIGELEPLRAQLEEKTALADELENLSVALHASVQELYDGMKRHDAAFATKSATIPSPSTPDERLRTLKDFWASNDKLHSDFLADELAARMKAAAELAALRALVTEKDALIEDARGKAVALEQRIAEVETVLGTSAAQAEERNAAMETLKADLDEAQSELKARTAHAGEQAGTIAALHAELESVRRVLVQMRAFVGQAARRMADLDQVHRRLQDELAAAKLAVEQKKASVSALTDSVAALTAELEPLRAVPAALAEKESELAEREALVGELRAQMALREEELKELTEAKDALVAELEPLRPLPALAAEWGALVGDLRGQLATASGETNTQAAERERLMGVLEQKDALLRDLGEQLPRLEQRLMRLGEMLAKGKTVIGEQAAAIAKLEPLRGLPDVVAQKDALLENLRGQLAPLEARLTILVDQLESGTAHSDQQASTIAALTTDLETLRRVLPEREARVGELEQALKRIQDEQLDASLLHAQESKEQADTIVALKGELEPLRPLPNLMTEKDACIDDLRAKHESLETRLEELDAAKRHLEDEHRNRSNLFSELEHKLADKTSLVDRLRGSIAPLEQGIVLLRGKLTEQNTLVDQLRDAIPPLQRRIADQDRHMRQLEEQLKAKEASVAALTIEIEPLRGVPPMLADEKARAAKLQASMQEYDRRVRHLTEQLAELERLPQQLADEKARAAQLVASIHDLEARIVEQDRHTRHLEETIATGTHELESLRSLPQKLSEERTLVVQLRASLQPLEQRVSKLDRQLKVKNDSIASLRQQSTLVDQLERRLREQELEIGRLEEHLDAGRVLAKTVEEQAQRIMTLTRDLEQQRERLREMEVKAATTAELTAEVEKLRPLQDEVRLLRDHEKEQEGVIATLTADLEPLRSNASQVRELQVLIEDLRGSELGSGSRDVFVESTPRQGGSHQRLADGARTPTPRRQESDTESDMSARQQLEDKIWQQDARLRDLRDALARAESKLATHKDYGNILQRKLRNVELKLATMQSTSAAREAKLASELVETRQQLELASATASVASLPSSVGDDMSENDLVTMFDDISKAVYEFSRRVSRKLYRGRREVVMHPHAWALKQVDEDLFQYLRPFLEHAAAASATVPEAVASTTEATLHWLLFITVFASFMPLQFSQADDRLGAFLLQLQQNIQSDVPQEQGARWRAITYKTMKKGRDDAALVPAISKYMFDTLVLGLAVFRDRASVASHLRELWSDVSRIVRMALDWQDHARSSHFAYDYSAFLPKVRAAYVDDEMETPDGPVRPGPPGGPRTVMLPLSMGLMASRTEAMDEGLARVNRVLKKAHVLVAL